MTKKNILAFDVSSSCIGWCNLEEDNNKITYLNSGYFKLKSKEKILTKLFNARNSISLLIKKINPTHIAIEDLIKFMKNKSSANTIIALTTFNRMICLLAYDHLGKAPELFNVMSIRHGIKLSPTLPAKEEIPKLVEKRLNFTFNFETNKKGNYKPENFDRADAIAVATYYALKLTNNLYKKPVKPKKLKK